MEWTAAKTNSLHSQLPLKTAQMLASSESSSWFPWRYWLMQETSGLCSVLAPLSPSSAILISDCDPQRHFGSWLSGVIPNQIGNFISKSLDPVTKVISKSPFHLATSPAPSPAKTMPRAQFFNLECWGWLLPYLVHVSSLHLLVRTLVFYVCISVL